MVLDVLPVGDGGEPSTNALDVLLDRGDFEETMLFGYLVGKPVTHFNFLGGRDQIELTSVDSRCRAGDNTEQNDGADE
jgi:hypothetical protein